MIKSIQKIRFTRYAMSFSTSSFISFISFIFIMILNIPTAFASVQCHYAYVMSNGESIKGEQAIQVENGEASGKFLKTLLAYKIRITHDSSRASIYLQDEVSGYSISTFGLISKHDVLAIFISPGKKPLGILNENRIEGVEVICQSSTRDSSTPVRRR